jgi:uncharacterized protein YndB with AHSA1/START domain
MNITADNGTDLAIDRVLRAPRQALWRCWSEPALLVQWWCPRPWTTELRALEWRPGGAFHTTMRGPDGGESDNPGCLLEIVPGERLVFTNLLHGGWRPAVSWLPMTAVFTLADADGGTRYRAEALHPDAETCRRHAGMGFFEGWNAAIDQLDELALGLA